MAMAEQSSRLWNCWRIDAAGLAVAALLAGGAYFLEIRPLLGQRDIYEAQCVEATAKKQQIQELRGSLRSVNDQLRGVEQALAQRNITLQGADQINQRLARVTDLGMENGLTVDGIEPGATVRSAHYQTIAIRLNGRGTYRSCIAFFHAVQEKLPDSSIISFRMGSQGSTENAAGTFDCQLLWHTAPSAGQTGQ
jgi:Tfp pilus assembly protein PilO